MSRQHLFNEIWVPAPIDSVWNFASDPKNLAGISPSYFGISVKTSGELQNGSRVEIFINPFGMPINLKWTAVLSNFVTEGPLRKFEDTAESGPFKYWKHEHIFEEGTAQVQGERSNSKVTLHEKGCWIRDKVEYEAPFSILGDIAHALLLRKSLEKMFAYRSEKLIELFTKKTTLSSS